MRELLEQGARVEAAFLDSEHSFEQVLQEFRLATELVCEGGLIILHDVLLPSGGVGRCADLLQEEGYGVARLWTASSGQKADEGLGLAIVENRKLRTHGT